MVQGAKYGWRKGRGSPRYVKLSRLGLSGRSVIRVDRRIRALPPGVRTTRWGSKYYERRANRADRSKRLRL